MAEYDVNEGVTVQHYGPRDWFPVVDADWWEREWLMCADECKLDVTGQDGEHWVEWSEVREALEALGATGPYGEGDAFAELTYNHENSLSDELLILAGWVDVSDHALDKGPGSIVLRAVKAHLPEHDWGEIGRVYIVATARGGCYGHSDATADVYLSPNMDDDYDVARWGALMVADETGGRSSHPVWDASGGWGDTIDGLEGTGYPYGARDDRMPMYDVSDLTGDPEDDDMPTIIDHAWLACGGEGVFAIGADGRVHRVTAYVG